MEQQVLIVGAGPTGLVMALWLNRLGIACRIIDKAPQPGKTSRTMVVHARTLELYDELGVADEVIAAGETGTVLNAHLDRKLIARIPFGDFGGGLSAYPFLLVLPQDAHERVLRDELKKVDILVEQDCELIGLNETNDGVVAMLKTSRDEEDVQVDYLCDCDGAHSPYAKCWV